MSDVPAEKAPSITKDEPSRAYRTYVLVILTLVYTFNFIDRQIIGILTPAIKADLGLADWQLGILQGIAFALLYTVLGIPVARLADRINRVSIVSVALAMWSGFTVISGFTSNFAQLALARVGVGIGEAGGSPPSHSLISDYYPKEKRAGALAFYAMGIPIGIAFAYLGAGWLAETFGWRIAFIAVGAPGIALAILLKLTVRERPRGGLDGNTQDTFNTANEKKLGWWALTKSETIKTWQAARHLLSIPSYRGVAIAATGISFTSYAMGGWIVAFYKRSHPDFDILAIYFWLGVIAGTAYVAGTFLGGWLVDKLSLKDKRMYGFVPAIALLVNTPCFLMVIWTGNPVISLIFQVPVNMATGFYLGPSFALAQTLAPVSVRALSTAVLFFIINLIALGLGPTTAGFISSALTDAYGEALALRLALTAVSAAGLYGAWMFYQTGKRVPADWAKATGEKL